MPSRDWPFEDDDELPARPSASVNERSSANGGERVQQWRHTQQLTDIEQQIISLIGEINVWDAKTSEETRVMMERHGIVARMRRIIEDAQDIHEEPRGTEQDEEEEEEDVRFHSPLLRHGTRVLSAIGKRASGIRRSTSAAPGMPPPKGPPFARNDVPTPISDLFATSSTATTATTARDPTDIPVLPLNVVKGTKHIAHTPHASPRHGHAPTPVNDLRSGSSTPSIRKHTRTTDDPFSPAQYESKLGSYHYVKNTPATKPRVGDKSKPLPALPPTADVDYEDYGENERVVIKPSVVLNNLRKSVLISERARKVLTMAAEVIDLPDGPLGRAPQPFASGPRVPSKTRAFEASQGALLAGSTMGEEANGYNIGDRANGGAGLESKSRSNNPYHRRYAQQALLTTSATSLGRSNGATGVDLVGGVLRPDTNTTLKGAEETRKAIGLVRSASLAARGSDGAGVGDSARMRHKSNRSVVLIQPVWSQVSANASSAGGVYSPSAATSPRTGRGHYRNASLTGFQQSTCTGQK